MLGSVYQSLQLWAAALWLLVSDKNSVNIREKKGQQEWDCPSAPCQGLSSVTLHGGGSGDSSSNNIQIDVPPENIFLQKTGNMLRTVIWQRAAVGPRAMRPQVLWTQDVFSVWPRTITPSRSRQEGLHGLGCSKKGAPGFWKQLSAKRTLELIPGFSALDLLQFKSRCRPGLSNVNIFPT